MKIRNPFIIAKVPSFHAAHKSLPAPQALLTFRLPLFTTVRPLLECYINRIIVCSLFSVAYSLSLMLSDSSNINAHVNSLFFVAKQYSNVWTQHNMFRCSPIIGHLDCFHLEDIMNNSSTMNLCD